MEKLFKIIGNFFKACAVLFFLSIWVFTLWYWWQDVHTTDSSFFDKAASFVIVVFANIFLDVFLYGTYDIINRAVDTASRIIDKLSE